MEPNEWRLHKAHRVCRTSNWKGMQNERALSIVWSHCMARNTAACVLIGPRTMPIVQARNTCPQLSSHKTRRSKVESQYKLEPKENYSSFFKSKQRLSEVKQWRAFLCLSFLWPIYIFRVPIYSKKGILTHLLPLPAMKMSKHFGCLNTFVNILGCMQDFEVYWFQTTRKWCPP